MVAGATCIPRPQQVAFAAVDRECSAAVQLAGRVSRVSGAAPRFVLVLEDNLKLPFETKVLGVPVTVAKIDMVGLETVAVCVNGRHRQAVPILDLPLPTPAPSGAEWIEAYRRWSRGR